jgi:DNA-binding transcriptional LysR family regulator
MDFETLFSRGLSLDKIRTFLLVVREGSVVAASKGNASRRSLMSRQLNELESTLGFALFNRVGKKLALTEAGRRIALVAASFVDELTTATAEIEGESRSICIGAGSSTLETIVYPKLPALLPQFRGIQFEFQADSTEGLLRALREGKLAMAILRSDAVTQDHLYFPVGSMEFVMVVRRDFVRDAVTWSVEQIVENAPMAMIGGSGSLVRIFKEICQTWGMSPSFQYQVDTFGHVRELLLAGCPAGLLPTALAKGLPRESFALAESDEFKRLSRQFAIVVEKRVARTRDTLKSTAERLAQLLH